MQQNMPQNVTVISIGCMQRLSIASEKNYRQRKIRGTVEIRKAKLAENINLNQE